MHWPSAANALLLGWVLAVWIAVANYNRWCRNALRRAWIARGTPDPSPTVYRVEDDGLVLVCPGYRAELPWAAISEISRSGLNWVIFGEGVAYYLPKRLFSNPQDELGFINACRQRLSSEAISRSKEVGD
jgi:hypothetical protein